MMGTGQFRRVTIEPLHKKGKRFKAAFRFLENWFGMVRGLDYNCSSPVIRHELLQQCANRGFEIKSSDVTIWNFH
jgi:hypothetical protein